MATKADYRTPFSIKDGTSDPYVADTDGNMVFAFSHHDDRGRIEFIVKACNEFVKREEVMAEMAEALQDCGNDQGDDNRVERTLTYFDELGVAVSRMIDPVNGLTHTNPNGMPDKYPQYTTPTWTK